MSASDPAGLTATQTFEATVANRAPEAAGAIEDRTLHVGETATVDVSASFTDPDGDPLSYGASSSDATVASVTVSGSTVTVSALAQGSATITVSAADPAGLTATQTFEATVANRAPEAAGAIEDRTLHVGETATVDASVSFTDPDGDPLSYGASSSDATVASVTVSGSTVTVSALAQGSATITVSAADPAGLTATQTFEATVANRAPEAAGAIEDRTLHVGETATVDASVSFTDPDGDALSYGASSSDASVASVTVSGSAVTVSALAQGSATITVSASDPAGLTATQTFEATVANRAPEAAGAIEDRTLHVGETATVDVSGSFTDPDGDALSYGASSSDASVASVSVSGSAVTVSALAQGSATITVSASDPRRAHRHPDVRGDGGQPCARAGGRDRGPDTPRRRDGHGGRVGELHGPRRRPARLRCVVVGRLGGLRLGLGLGRHRLGARAGFGHDHRVGLRSRRPHRHAHRERHRVASRARPGVHGCISVRGYAQTRQFGDVYVPRPEPGHCSLGGDEDPRRAVAECDHQPPGHGDRVVLVRETGRKRGTGVPPHHLGGRAQRTRNHLHRHVR